MRPWAVRPSLVGVAPLFGPFWLPLDLGRDGHAVARLATLRIRASPECHRAILGEWEASKIWWAGSGRHVAGCRLTARLMSAPAVTSTASQCPLLIATSCVTFSWLRIRPQ